MSRKERCPPERLGMQAGQQFLRMYHLRGEYVKDGATGGGDDLGAIGGGRSPQGSARPLGSGSAYGVMSRTRSPFRRRVRNDFPSCSKELSVS